MRLLFSLSVLFFLSLHIRAQDLQQNISVHDPVMIKHGDTYYLFSTGMGISVWSSADMKNWKKENQIFSQAPQWAVDAIPSFKNHIWAPDISYYKGTYYLYYSVSAFGKNTSCIALATNTTLNPVDKSFKWVDHGKIIQSIPGKTNWNAIDPNLITDKKGEPYLAFGSFWNGLQLVKLHKNRLSIAQKPEDLITIASRKENLNSANPPSVDGNPVDAGGNAIEAPFIFKHGNYYYLFASIDYCCKGVNSTYKMIMGKSSSLKGPYVDKDEKPMAKGGGTILMKGDANWYGVGHNAVCHFDGLDYLVFHGYDASDNGKPKLRIEKLKWDNKGWPSVQ
ncbi:MAG: transporter substrate-binding protein [Sphingobacteriales bacterium]|nr:transporter substrate-binding protein [Sphingobacteriales bacterium]